MYMLWQATNRPHLLRWANQIFSLRDGELYRSDFLGHGLGNFTTQELESPLFIRLCDACSSEPIASRRPRKCLTRVSPRENAGFVFWQW
jgi:hypothetical protein